MRTELSIIYIRCDQVIISERFADLIDFFMQRNLNLFFQLSCECLPEIIRNVLHRIVTEPISSSLFEPPDRIVRDNIQRFRGLCKIKRRHIGFEPGGEALFIPET